MNEKEQAQDLMRHYFTMFQSGETHEVSSDNFAEWDHLIDLIVDATADEVERRIAKTQGGAES